MRDREPNPFHSVSDTTAFLTVRISLWRAGWKLRRVLSQPALAQLTDTYHLVSFHLFRPLFLSFP